MIDGIKIFISFIGGLALFIYGMEIMSKGFQASAGEKLSTLLSIATSSKLLAVFVGAAATVLVQSSSATTVMIVGFVNAGLMNLTQSVGVIMGANIGTTVTSWIVSSEEWTTFLKPTTLAPLIVASGVFIRLITKRSKTKDICNILIGFGILFIGMSSMSGAVKGLRDAPQIVTMFQTFGTNPILGVLAGVLVTFLVQSSSASVGILQSMTAQGLVPYAAAVYIIMGQNIGTCITAIISSIGASKNAKAASYIHLLFNIIGSVVFTIIAIIYFNTFGKSFASSIVPAMTTISIIHTIFNFTNTAMLYPFSDKIVTLAKKMAKIEDETSDELPKEVHLDERLLETPSIAFELIDDEILKLSNLASDIVTFAGKSITESKDKYFNKVNNTELKINETEKELVVFITKAIKENLTSEEHDRSTDYLHILSDLERIGDHSVNIAESTQFLTTYNTSLSEQATSEINSLIEITTKCLSTSIKSFKESSVILATETCELESEIDNIVDKLRNDHIERLSKNECSPQAGIIYWDILSNFERISDHARNIAEIQLKK